MARKQIPSAADKFNGIVAEREKPKEKELEAHGQQRIFEEEAKDVKSAKTRTTNRKKADEASQDEVQKKSVQEYGKIAKIGQPKKYDEPTKHISFSLPITVIENLKILAGLRKTNQTQLILSLINKEIESEADKIAAYRELLK